MTGRRIEDYALIGNMRTAALVGRDGSVDWYCPPRFDSPACFASLLGTEENGRWLIAPKATVRETRRSYRGDTLVLETEFVTETGRVSVVDFMPPGTAEGCSELIRLVRGVEGRVEMRTEVVLRFDYGTLRPWVHHVEDGMRALAGPDAITLLAPVTLSGKDFRSTAEFTVAAGETVPFVLLWHASHLPSPEPPEPLQRLEETASWWTAWSARCTYEGPWREAVLRSLITLKALTYAPTGGIVAAPTASLPEQIGGERNWDYRYCWLRDATFTLYALLISGYRDEARAWREWLLRAVAGAPSQLQPLYGVAGERRITEFSVEELAGFEGSRPVRIGNAAHGQVQLDVYGEMMDAFHVARRYEVEPLDDAWAVQRALLDYLEGHWADTDRGIWEVRGPERCFTHSKVMAWVAMDRAVKAVRTYGLTGPVERWAALRAEIHADVCAKGFSEKRNSFAQYYGGDSLDGALLMMPLVGFLPADDPRILGTVRAIREGLAMDGLIRRYETDGADGLRGDEGAFLPCTFWLVDNLAMTGQMEEAREIFGRLLSVRNDVGLLAEEYDPVAGRQLGNFPQAFSHIGLINTAHNLSRHRGPSERRAAGGK